MKLGKKSIGIIIVALLVVGIASWFLITRNNKSEQTEKQDTKISEEVTKQSEQNNQKNIVEDKNEELVWYEIPELNIKFKVTKNMKKNLVYKMINNKVWFCDLGLMRFSNAKNKSEFINLTNDDFLSNCSQGNLGIIKKDNLVINGGDAICTIVLDLGDKNNEILCFAGPHSPATKELEYRSTVGKNIGHINAKIIKESISFIK